MKVQGKIRQQEAKCALACCNLCKGYHGLSLRQWKLYESLVNSYPWLGQAQDPNKSHHFSIKSVRHIFCSSYVNVILSLPPPKAILTIALPSCVVSIPNTSGLVIFFHHGASGLSR